MTSRKTRRLKSVGLNWTVTRDRKSTFSAKGRYAITQTVSAQNNLTTVIPFKNLRKFPGRNSFRLVIYPDRTEFAISISHLTVN